MMTPEKTSRRWCRAHFGDQAYTLFEVLLALGIIAILLGVTVPLITSSWNPSVTEQISQSIEACVQSAHKSSLETGEARQLLLQESGLAGKGGIASAPLPKGWKLQVRRFTETRFRKPQRDEFWNFNGAGICDPLELRLVSKDESVVLKFDPLTALLETDEN
ncbi:MAG: prepilin-type N-terminal cleavage/methylation domain-containing protein [bacterium]